MEKMADKRKQKGSKKSKRSWRKNTDITDVEEHLEDVRRDVRTGGAVTNEVDKNIFYIDKDKNANIKSEKTKISNREEDNDEDEELYVSRKQKLAEKLKNDMEKERKMVAAQNKKIQNIWGQEVMEVKDQFLEPAMKKPKVKPVTFCIGKSNDEALSIPDPGTSYNPDYESHQDLLRNANDVEVKKMKERQKLNEKIKSFSVQELKNQSKVWLKEMSEGLFNQNEDDNDVKDKENDDEVGDLGTMETDKSDNPKTSKKRRKEKLLKKEERQRVEEKKERLRLNDINRIKSLKKEIKKSDLISSERQTKKMHMKLRTRTKRLSKHRYEDGNIAVQLTEELTGSLRELKPTGSLVEDGFKSLQKRNIIETRKPVIPHRRYKKKAYEKRSYRTKTIKDFDPKS